MSDLKYRFDELITTINLLPESPSEVTQEDMGSWVFPNLTRDLAEPELFTAIMAQTFKGDEAFKFKICAVLTNSAVKSVEAKMNRGEEADNDDLHAFAIAGNILWAEGQSTGMFHVLDMLAQTCERFDKPMPDLATIILRPNHTAHRFGRLNPYDILNEDMDVDKMFEVLSEERE